MQGVFELVTIITLGSAAGDPMFYKKVGLLPAGMVFLSILLMYRLTNFFVARFKNAEHLIEGRHVRLVKDGRFAVENLKPEVLIKERRDLFGFADGGRQSFGTGRCGLH